MKTPREKLIKSIQEAIPGSYVDFHEAKNGECAIEVIVHNRYVLIGAKETSLKDRAVRKQYVRMIVEQFKQMVNGG